MSGNSLDELDLIRDIEFIVKYCDVFLDFCHEENLSIDGNIAGEINDSIADLEQYLENSSEVLNEDDINEILDLIGFIREEISNLNDISLFNNVHIVFYMVLEEIVEKLDKNRGV